MDEADVARTARSVVRIAAPQANELPRPYNAPPLFDRTFLTGCLIRDGACVVTGHDHPVNTTLADPTEALPPGATAQNRYRGPGDYICSLCGTRLHGDELDDHNCQDA
jgi:hypothetical protein